jgi:hypothetical protein
MGYGDTDDYIRWAKEIFPEDEFTVFPAGFLHRDPHWPPLGEVWITVKRVITDCEAMEIEAHVQSQASIGAIVHVLRDARKRSES